MPTIVNVNAARTHFSRPLQQARRGDEIILAKAATPYARLVPPAEKLVVRRPATTGARR